MRAKEISLILVLVGLTTSIHARSTIPPSPAAKVIRDRSELQLSRTQIRRLQRLDAAYLSDVRPIHERMLETKIADRRRRARAGQLDHTERIERAREHADLLRDAAYITRVRDQSTREVHRILTPRQRTKAVERQNERR